MQSCKGEGQRLEAWEPEELSHEESGRRLFQVRKKGWRFQGPAKARVAGSSKRRDWGREGLGRPLSDSYRL